MLLAYTTIISVHTVGDLCTSLKGVVSMVTLDFGEGSSDHLHLWTVIERLDTEMGEVTVEECALCQKQRLKPEEELPGTEHLS